MLVARILRRGDNRPAVKLIMRKKQIASLYSEFGMRIIADMFSTAKEAKIIEDKIAAAKDSISDYEQELEALSWGPYNLEV